MKKILISASGGDAPGVNNYIYELVKKHPELEVYYSPYGIRGIADDKIKPFKKEDTSFLYDLPTAFIKCGRFPEFKDDLDKREKVINKLKEFDYFILLGGNGSQKAASIISQNGIKTIFIPLTIDNDVEETDATLGYHTSLRDVVKNTNNISYTMEAHGYVGLIEIMGRGCSDLTTEGLALSKAQIATYKENILTPDKFAEGVKKVYETDGYCVGLIMEKMKYKIEDYKKAIDEIGLTCRNTSLGHTQRGGIADIADIRLANAFVKGTIDSMKNNIDGTIAIENGEIKTYEHK